MTQLVAAIDLAAPVLPPCGARKPLTSGVVVSSANAAARVRAILSVPNNQLDYARAKLALDKIIDPSLDENSVAGELDRMVRKARRLTGKDATDEAKLAALRKLIYQSGPWNDHRPFDYDHDNFRGGNVRVKLISHYLETRRGDCVSMPTLFLILADKLDLDVSLATVPLHFFVRHRDREGHVTNLETTAGALPARDCWLRQNRPFSDRALDSGLYLRTLTRRETVAQMAIPVLQHLNDQHRFEDTIAVADAILEHNPRCGHTLANKGNAYSHILRRQFLDKYGSAFLIPLPLRPRYLLLLQHNHATFAAARALGWEHCV